MVAGRNWYQKICHFHEVKVGEQFASTKEDADYVKVDDTSGKRIWRRVDEIGLFEKNELVYIHIYDSRAWY